MVILSESEESWYMPIVAQLSLNTTSRREGTATGGSMQLYAALCKYDAKLYSRRPSRLRREG